MSTEQDKSKLVSTWDDVESMIKARAFPKWAGKTIVGILVVLVVFFAAGVWNTDRIDSLVNENRQLVTQIKTGSITNCHAGNRARATNRLIWDEFLTLSVKNPNTPKIRSMLEHEIGLLHLPDNRVKAFDLIIDAIWTTNPANLRLVHMFEDYIAAHEYPVNCAQAYDP